MLTFNERFEKKKQELTGTNSSSYQNTSGITKSSVPSSYLPQAESTQPVSSTKKSFEQRREETARRLTGSVSKPAYTPQEKLNTSTGNYETRLAFSEVDVEPEDSFLKKAGNKLLGLLDIIDRPRNATWNAIKSGQDKYGETGDSWEALKSFGSGFGKGLTGEERFTGTDLSNEMFGEATTRNEKIRNFTVALGSEMLLDPLNFVTFGAGKLAKGFLTGKSATLSDDAIKAIARSATAPITPDNITRGMKVVFDNPDALVKTGVFTEEVASKLKSVKEYANNIFEYNAILKNIKEDGIKAFDGLADKMFDTPDNIMKAFVDVEEAIDTASRGFIEGALKKSLGKYGMDKRQITAFVNSINLADINDVADNFAKPLQEFIATNLIGVGEEALRTSAELGGKGLSFMGRSVKTGSQLQDMGAGASSAIRNYGFTNSDALSSVARGFTKTQDSVSSVFSKYFVPGVSKEQSNMFKSIINSSDNMRALADEDTVTRVVAYQQKLADQVTKDYPTLSGEALFRKIEDYEKGIMDFVELGENHKVVADLLAGETPEMGAVLTQISKGVERDLIDMGLSEAHIGKLSKIMDGYMPHVKSTKLKNITREELQNINIEYRFAEDPAEQFARHTGNSGKTVGVDFTASNASGRRRMYNTTIDYANLIKKLNTSSYESAEQFFQTLGAQSPDLMKRLKEGGFLFTRDSSYGIKTMTEDPETLQMLMDIVDPAMFAQLDGVENFFETSALKSLLVRELQHNRVIAQADTARDMLYSLGRPLSKFDKEGIRDYRSRGWDIVVTKGYFENLNTGDLETLLKSAGQNADFISKIVRDSLGSTDDSIRALSGSEVETLLDIFSETKIPVEIFAVPQQIRKTFNSVAKSQVDEGFSTIGKTIDALHRKWKPLVTGYRPDFHARNYISSTMNDMLDNGMKSLNPRYKLMANKVARQSDEIVTIAGEKFTGAELYRAMKEAGALSNMTRDLSPDALEDALRFKLKVSNKSLGKKALNLYESAGHKVGNVVEDNLRANNFVINMERALENGMDVPRAIKYSADKVKEFHFDYSDLSEVERKLLRRITPFYTWARKNIPLQIEQFLDNPAMYGKVGDIVNTSADQQDVDLNTMAEWGQGTLPITTPFKDKSGNPVMLSGLFPQSDLQQVLGSPKDFVQGQLASMTPFLKAPMELTLNKNFLTEAPIYTTEAEKNQKLMEYAMGQTGFLKDATRTITQQGKPSGEFSSTFGNAPFGVTNSLIKSFDQEKAVYNRGQDYNRYLADIVQGYSKTDAPIMTINEIKSLEEMMLSIPGMLKNKDTELGR